MKFTKAQEDDITKRVAKATLYLKGLELFPSAVVKKENIGNDIFVDKVICYLQDSKYTPTRSPIQPNDITKT